MMSGRSGLGTIALAISFWSLGVSAPRADMIDRSGMEPWEVCGLCHGFDGLSAVAKFPKLAGQRATYIEKQFRDFRAGRRRNDGGQMEAISTELEPHLVQKVAAYFSTLAAPRPGEEKGAGFNLGRELFGRGREGLPACAGCHDPAGAQSSGTLAPWLEAQHRDYLVKQLADFASGARDNDPAGAMNEIAAALQPGEREALADFLAASERPQREP
ncbi:c-type cytochrome [Allomesorhizobium alhagi]|uniref:Cytochrome c553 n=1 Tax=Mesorhizobium alhagi CCNWXJ12-2 TaxID=1107882 RepID=H0I1S2_9HYPH|nr:cytochrome c553 [Mesorhizobium alhagi]EHK53062.1 cytochrome c553 [Mesorhizobium alhagi CCNWXJ12-2]